MLPTSEMSRLKRSKWLYVLKQQENPKIDDLIKLEDNENKLPMWHSETECYHFWNQMESNFEFHLDRLLQSRRLNEASSGVEAVARKELQDEAMEFITAVADAIWYAVMREEEHYPMRTPVPLLNLITVMERLVNKDTLNYQVISHIADALSIWCNHFIYFSNHITKAAFFSFLQRSVRMSVQGSAVKADVVRVWNFSEGVTQFIIKGKLSPDIKWWLLTAIKCAIFITTNEGQSFIAYTMTINKTLTEEIHKVVLHELNTCDLSSAQQYAEIYYTAWERASPGMREMIENKLHSCVQDFIKFQRKGVDLSPLGANVFSIITYFHAQRKNQDVMKMLYSMYNTFLWMCIEDDNQNNRCNAAQLLFDVYPMTKPGADRDENALFLEKQHQALSKFLSDRCHLIRIIAIRQICGIVADYWLSISMDTINGWMKTIIMSLANDTSSEEVCISVYRSLPKVFKCSHAVEYMKTALPHLKNNFHDANQKVREAFVDMLMEYKKTNVNYWEVMPMRHILAWLEIENHDVGVKLVNLIFDYFISPNFESSYIMDQLANLILMNREAVRMFFLRSDKQLNAKQSMDLIMMILPCMISHVKEVLEQKGKSGSGLAVRTVNNYKNRNKRRRKLPSAKENVVLDSSSDKEEDSSVDSESNEDMFVQLDLHNPLIAQGYINSVCVLWTKHAWSYENLKYKEELKKLHQLCSEGVPLFLRYYKDTEVFGSVLYLCCLIPTSLLRLISNVESILIRQLKKLTLASKTRDILIRVQPLCMWGHGYTILDVAKGWLSPAFEVNDLNPSLKHKVKRKRKRRAQEAKPRMGLRLLAVLIDSTVIQTKLLMNNYSQLLDIWRSMEKIKMLVEKRMELGCPFDDPLLSDKFLKACFRQYVILIPILDGELTYAEDNIDSVHMYSSLIEWAHRCIIPKVPKIVNASDFCSKPLCFHFIKIILDVAGDMAISGVVDERLCCLIGKFILGVLRTDYKMMFVHVVTQYLSKFVRYVTEYHEEDFFNLFRSVTITIVAEILNIFGEKHYDQNMAERLLEDVTYVKDMLFKVLVLCKKFGSAKSKFYYVLVKAYVINILSILKHEFSVVQVVDILKKTSDLPFLAQQLAVWLVKDNTFPKVFPVCLKVHFCTQDFGEEPLLLLAGFNLLHLLAVDPEIKIEKKNLKPVLESLEKSLNKFKKVKGTQGLSVEQNVAMKLNIASELETLKNACRLQLCGAIGCQ